MKKLISLLLIGGFSGSAFASDITQKLRDRELLYTRYKKVMYDFSDHQRRLALDLWVRKVLEKKSETGKYIDPSSQFYFENTYGKFKDQIRNQRILTLALHYYYVGDLSSFKDAVEFYFFSLAKFIEELSENPFHNEKNPSKKKARELAAGDLLAPVMSLRACLDRAVPSRALKAEDYLGFDRPLDEPPAKDKRTTGIQHALDSCLKLPQLIGYRNFLQQLITKSGEFRYDYDYKGPPFVTSYLGFLGGNDVEHFTRNGYDESIIRFFGDKNIKFRSTKNAKVGKKYVDMSVADFKKLMITPEAAVTNLFTKDEGFSSSFDPESPEFHKVFAQGKGERPNLFHQFFTSLEQAQDSIFIDVFFLGGSMGVFLAKKLMKLATKRDGPRIFVMTDMENPLGYAIELNPVFRFLRAFSEKFPELGVVVLPANVKLKRTALPPFVDLALDENAMTHLLDSDYLHEYKLKMSMYPKGKSDHSKVYVIDGRSLTDAVSFVGSKNLTDASGGVAYDEVTRVRGPGAVAIQDSYYYDLLEALRQEWDGEGKPYLLAIAKASGLEVTGDTSFYEVAMAILAPVDVLDRVNGGKRKVEVADRGEVVLQIGQNNVYGTVRSPLEQNIQIILSAREQIIISDQFLYEARIILALKEALQKNDALKVWIMLADLTDSTGPIKPLAHIPNNMFLPDLAYLKGKDGKPRIKVKWKKVPDADVAALKAIRNQSGELDISLAPEYHLKAISADGVLETKAKEICSQFGKKPDAELAEMLGELPVLVSGSANKDNMTMSGGFREFQLVIYGDKVSSLRHDCTFWERWSDPDQSRPAIADEFSLPPALEGKTTPAQFLDIFRAIFVGAYNFKEIIYE